MGWGALVNFALQYQEVKRDSGSQYAVFDRQRIEREEIDRRPVLARIHWVFSFASEKKSEDETDGAIAFNSGAHFLESL